MAVYFFDSSAIVKRYVQEAGTSRVIGLTDPAARHDIYLARIAGVEVISAIARRSRSGGLSTTTAAQVLADFRFDFASQYQTFEITAALITRAMTLAETHALRGYDAVQLAAALEAHHFCSVSGLPALTLISADEALNTAAMAEGLAVDDPNVH